MKKHFNLRAALALLLSLCVLLGGMPVLAEEPAAEVSATGNPTDITVKINTDVDGNTGTGIKVEPKELAPPVDIQVDSKKSSRGHRRHFQWRAV